MYWNISFTSPEYRELQIHEHYIRYGNLFGSYDSRHVFVSCRCQMVPHWLASIAAKYGK